MAPRRDLDVPEALCGRKLGVQTSRGGHTGHRWAPIPQSRTNAASLTSRRRRCRQPFLKGGNALLQPFLLGAGIRRECLHSLEFIATDEVEFADEALYLLARERRQVPPAR